MSIDPYDDVELYEMDQIEDKIVEMIVLTDKETKKGKETGTEKDKEKPEEAAQPELKGQTKASTSADEPNQVVVPDLVTRECAEEYVVTDPEQDDTVTISSTSTADYDRDEAEDIIDKIASCHTSLAKHYEEVNKIIPHMTKTQLALYLRKLPVMPMVKAEGKAVSKLYVPEEGADPNFEYPVQGDSWEEKLKFMTEHILAEKLLFAIAIGDHTLNQFSQAKTALKYGFAKTRIIRALSHNPSHRKAGRQYIQERKRKDQTQGGEEVETEEVLSAKKIKVQPPIPQEVLQHNGKDELGDLPNDAKGDPIFPDSHI